MRKTLYIVCALVAVNVQARVTDVTVYPWGAMVRQEQTLAIAAGESQVVWATDLRPQVQSDGLRIQLPEGVMLLDRRLEQVQQAKEVGTLRAKLAADVEQAQQRLQEVGDRKMLIIKHEGYIDQIQAASTAPVKGEAAYAFPPPAQWGSLIAYINEERAKVLAAKRKIEQEYKVAADELAQAQRALDNLDSQPAPYTQRLSLRLKSSKAIKNAPVAITYIDPNASWSPVYEVWVDSATKAVELGYAANIRQNTGSDWKQVRVKLSTARPQLSANPPELTPWWVSEQQPTPVMAYATMARGKAVNMAADSMALEAAPMAEVAEGLTYAEYLLPAMVDIPADNSEYRASIAQIPLGGELAYVVRPELDTQAYLQATVKNTSDYTLLAGSSQIYADGNLVGSARQPLVNPGEEWELNLGIDQAITVERKQISRKVERTGLGDTGHKINYVYKIEVQNNKKSPQRVNVTERIPLSQHEKIKVELVEPKKMAKSVDKEGKLTWQLDLKPGEKKELDLAYTVEYPKSMQVQGL